MFSDESDYEQCWRQLDVMFDPCQEKRVGLLEVSSVSPAPGQYSLATSEDEASTVRTMPSTVRGLIKEGGERVAVREGGERVAVREGGERVAVREGDERVLAREGAETPDTDIEGRDYYAPSVIMMVCSLRLEHSSTIPPLIKLKHWVSDLYIALTPLLTPYYCSYPSSNTLLLLLPLF